MSGAPGQHTLFGLHVPFLALLGVREEGAGNGRARLSLELRPELTNSFGAGHGGIVATLLDVAMAASVRVSNAHDGGVITVDMSIGYIRPAIGTVFAEGRILRGGGSIFFCEAEVTDSAGELLAKAIGTFKLHRRKSSAEGSD